MRNYWLRIFLGALAVFAIGMIGISLFRSGAERVRTVVEGDGPLDIPLAFIPFTIDGERLGTLQRLVVYRSEPSRVRAVEVYIDVGDSLLASGLSDCRLAAAIESAPSGHGLNIRAGRDSTGAFYCLPPDSTPAELVEFGEAILEPGDVRLPLFLHQDLVDELQSGFGHDSMAMPPEMAESIAAQAERQVDSALQASGLEGKVRGQAGRRLGDSLRAVARMRLDSVRQELDDLADSLPPR